MNRTISLDFSLEDLWSRMLLHRWLIILAIVWLALARVSSADGGVFTRESSVLDSSGGAYSNLSYSGVGAVGQGTPVGFNFNGAKNNYSGFLNTFVARPDLDNDMDGVADENDIDDDNDGLTDVAELTGSGFNPMTGTDLFDSDTDDDGTDDAEESVAGTNPQDPDSQLALIRVDLEAGDEVVEWKSRQGKTYYILRASNIFELVSGPETADVVKVTSGGVGPFLETTTTTTIPGTGDTIFYGVKVKP